jgi:hypothetical protein
VCASAAPKPIAKPMLAQVDICKVLNMDQAP